MLPPSVCTGGDVVAGVGAFHGSLARERHGSASDEAARAPEPLGGSVKGSVVELAPACATASVHAPRVREASRWVLERPLPMVREPQMPLEVCHELPLAKVGRFFCEVDRTVPASARREGRCASKASVLGVSKVVGPGKAMVERVEVTDAMCTRILQRAEAGAGRGPGRQTRRATWTHRVD